MANLQGIGYCRAKYLTDGLMTKTHAHDWDDSGKLTDYFQTDAGFIGCAGAWRDDNCLNACRINIGHCNSIVTNYLQFTTQLLKISGQVVTKGIVIVDQ